MGEIILLEYDMAVASMLGVMMLSSHLIMVMASTSPDDVLRRDLIELQDELNTFEKEKPMGKCWGLPDRTCEANPALGQPAEACSSKWDYGWCNGCVCAHCKVPPTAAEACLEFDPRKTCVDAYGKKQNRDTNTQGRDTPKNGNWCGCCDKMWKICKFPNFDEGLYQQYLSTYDWKRGGKDYSGSRKCPVPGNQNPAWRSS